MFGLKKSLWLFILKYGLVVVLFVIGIFVTSFNSALKIKDAQQKEQNIKKVKLALKECGCKKTYEEIVGEKPK